MILFKQKKITPFLTGCLILLFLNGCVSSLFSGGPSAGEDSLSALYAERVSAVREKEIFEKKCLTFCGTKDFPEDLLKQLKESLAEEKISLKVLPEAEIFSLTSFLRSGKVDLIGGRFTPGQIRSWRLVPVVPSAGKDSKESDFVYCFALRTSSPRLKEILEKITFSIKEKQLKESDHDIRTKRSRSESGRKKS